MGEAIIARGQTAAKNVLDDIPVSGDYCSILIQLKDSAGKPCENTKINCKDGSRWYNYTTNENGYALFKCNSGAANITANNWINGVYTFDQAAINKNYDAPVGTKILEILNFGKINHFKQINPGWINGQFIVTDRITNLVVVGGGGSGGGGGCGAGYITAGGGGGGGAKNYSSSISVVKNQIYNFSVGSGGKSKGPGNLGMSGSTSYAFGLSANGGSGGGLSTEAGSGGIGKYNGGNGSNSIQNYGNDGINGAGGGGGCGWAMGWGFEFNSYGGKNGGGNGYYGSQYSQHFSGDSGKQGSGGGGGGGSSGWWSPSAGYDSNGYGGGAGGSGRVEFDM